MADTSAEPQHIAIEVQDRQKSAAQKSLLLISFHYMCAIRDFS